MRRVPRLAGQRLVGLVALALAMSLAMSLAAAPAPADSLLVRGGQAAMAGEVRHIGPDGVEFAAAGGAPRLIGWARIAELHVEDPARAAEALPWMESAQWLWRGLQRLERGDAALALAAFDQVRDRFAEAAGETGLLWVEGELRARAGTGTLMESPADAWWLVLRADELRRGGADVEALQSVEDPVDRATAVIPALLPVFSAQEGAVASERLLLARPEGRDGREGRLLADRIARLAALSRPAGAEGPAPRSAGRVPDDLGTPEWRALCTLLDDWADALADSDSKRASGRKRLEESALPRSWMRAWAMVARARSLLREDPPRMEEAVLCLVEGAVIAKPDWPSLARWCAMDAAEILRSAGDAGAAARVEDAWRDVGSGNVRSD